MTAIIGNIVVVLVLLVVVFFAARSVYRNFKGGGCAGGCGDCNCGCGCGASKHTKKAK